MPAAKLNKGTPGHPRAWQEGAWKGAARSAYRSWEAYFPGLIVELGLWRNPFGVGAVFSLVGARAGDAGSGNSELLDGPSLALRVG